MAAKGLCGSCGGGLAQHSLELDEEGCWCRSCMKAQEAGGDRCKVFVVSRRKPVDRAVAPVGHAHPETAQTAALIARLRAGSRRKEAFDVIRNAGVRGLTDDEMEGVTGRSHQALSATRNTLMNDGLIVDSGQRRPTRYGHPAIAWCAVGYEQSDVVNS